MFETRGALSAAAQISILRYGIFLLHFLYKYKFNKLVDEAGYFIIDFVCFIENGNDILFLKVF